MEEGSEGVHRYDPGMVRREGKLHAISRLIRIEHTIFSLPYAYLGALLATKHLLLREIILIFLSVLGLRTAAMAYNNIADLPIDRLNPRSSRRPLVSGALTVKEAWIIVIAGSLIYYISAALLNWYAFLLSPLLWIIAITYPYAKRIHPVPHIHLGLTLGLVVFGGTVAAIGDEVRSLTELTIQIPWGLVIAVTMWVAGFDILYSIMDYEFDVKHNLGSIPAWLGINAARKVAIVFHIVFLALLLYTIEKYSLGLIAEATFMLTAILILLQHYIVAREGLKGIPVAFNINLAIGLIVGLGFSIDLILG
ncbi:MAG: UbiA family prenyltransferase [Crenarchaeota archaeon]|nr:UbiA family prenyltransferase [Thermoproteota archaeon]